MLTLAGTLKTATTLPGFTSKKGERIDARQVVQLEVIDGRGLCQLHTLTVPDLGPYEKLVGQEVRIPVRAYVSGGAVAFVLEDRH